MYSTPSLSTKQLRSMKGCLSNYLRSTDQTLPNDKESKAKMLENFIVYQSRQKLQRKTVINTTSVVHTDQNKTDLEKSLDYCKENSIKKVVILGSTGLREDHSMANVLIASTYSDILQIELITSFYRIIFVRENTKINAHNAPVSIISLSSDNKITTSGLKYDLNNEKLKSFSHGISNEVNGDNFTAEAENTVVVFIGI